MRCPRSKSLYVASLSPADTMPVVQILATTTTWTWCKKFFPYSPSLFLPSVTGKTQTVANFDVKWGYCDVGIKLKSHQSYFKFLRIPWFVSCEEFRDSKFPSPKQNLSMNSRDDNTNCASKKSTENPRDTILSSSN